MSYRDDPRWIDARKRFVARMADDEDPDASFARCAKAAYEMWLIETGRPVPEVVTYAESIGAYGVLAARTTPAADAA